MTRFCVFLLLLAVIGPLLQLNAPIFAATETPSSARAAVTKALLTESWTLDQSLGSSGNLVLDHPTSKKQIIMSRDVLTFKDFTSGETTTVQDILNLQFLEGIFKVFGIEPTPIAATLLDWVE